MSQMEENVVLKETKHTKEYVFEKKFKYTHWGKKKDIFIIHIKE